jgi:HEAT repeat protein
MLRPGPGLHDGGDELARKVAAIDLVACLRLRACFPDMIAASADQRLSETLLFAAADIGATLTPYLSPALSHRNRHVREFACRAMAAVAIERGAGALIPLLTDLDETIRVVAVRLMSRLHHAAGISALVGLLTDKSRSVREAAAESLCRMDAELVTSALLRNPLALGGQQPLVLSIMRANPHPLQRPFVESNLRNPSEEIRQAAIATLATQRGADLLGPLEPMIADPSVAVRRSAVAALADHPSERARQLLLGLLEHDAEMRGDVIRALARIGDDRVIPKTIAIFGACTPVQQAAALDALASIESPSVEAFISRQLGHRHPKVRRHAVRALVRAGTTTALRRVAVALRDGDTQVRLAVSKALASCPHPIARSALERLSLDPEATVATAARAQLGR